MEDEIDVEGLIEFYKQWCYKKAKHYLAPDPSKTDTDLYKGKAVLCLRSDKGEKLAMIKKTQAGYSVVWSNWFSGNSMKFPNNKSSKN